MYLFSIECISHLTGIAVLTGKKVIAKKIWKSEDPCVEILPQIDKMLKKTGMKPEMFDYFVVSSGPGSWTGIRLGMSVAYGLSIANEKKIFCVSSLEGMAYRFKNNEYTGVFLPSAGKSVHYGIFKNPGILAKKHGRFHVCSIGELSLKLKKANIVAGPSREILSLFSPSKHTIKRVFPDPILNAVLAYERIKNSVKPKNQPYYEK